MLAISADLLKFLADVPKETWSSIGTGIGLLVLAVLGTIASRKGAADKAAQPSSVPMPEPSPARGMTFLADADTERAILEELRGLRGDVADYIEAADRRREALERHELEVANDGLREELATLRSGQGVTHDNQGDIRADLDALKKMVAALKVH